MRHVRSITIALPMKKAPTWREHLVATQPNRQRRSGYTVTNQIDGCLKNCSEATRAVTGPVRLKKNNRY